MPQGLFLAVFQIWLNAAAGATLFPGRKRRSPLILNDIVASATFDAGSFVEKASLSSVIPVDGIAFRMEDSSKVNLGFADGEGVCLTGG